MDRSVSVSVGVVFELTKPTLSSGIEQGSPFRPGRIPTTGADVDAPEGTSESMGIFFLVVELSISGAEE